MRHLQSKAALFAALLATAAIPSTFAETVIPTLPQIAAHRGGTADAPENTLEAIRLAVSNRADIMWLTVQLSQDGVPVLYRPADLAVLSDVSGPVAARTAKDLSQVNVGWTFKGSKGDYPYRKQPVGVPTLSQALHALPANMPVILDLKALPAEPLALAVAKVLDEEQAWSRVTLYSTEVAFQQAFASYPKARMFESRDATRTRLAKVALNAGCDAPPNQPIWAGFELKRKLKVVEQFTLGEGVSDVNATMWTPNAVACFRKHAPVKIVAIAVNDADAYRQAACLGIDVVLSDSPKQMTAIRDGIPSKLQCNG
ncbi:glycerophosphodiester phosphodiesterase [Chromobacterium amazonense]|uniref:glycerophosphodiester phosphodiesterase family protein n=1 Tax=Chromobacterium amazonense TaxID=1382803 RepID=UPI0008DA05F3|nr:glycerophosphodiester phosphodiesterase family protein [Chromobacterium amazonense]OHX15313.1 glycerophosphodiester phosphodiesterase [Chromobacterium amazonense]